VGCRGSGDASAVTLSDWCSRGRIWGTRSLRGCKRNEGAARCLRVMLEVLTPVQPSPEDSLGRARFFIMAYRLHPLPPACGNGP
jgi:hypothetical protein